MHIGQAVDHVNASASPSDWLAWCSDWACWKPVAIAPEFSSKLKAPKGVSALPNRKGQNFPVEMKVSVTCQGEIFKSKTTDISKNLLELSDEAPRVFFQEPCEFELTYMVGPENRRMRFKGRITPEAGQKKKWSLKDLPAPARDFVAGCLACVNFGAAPTGPQHHKAA